MKCFSQWIAGFSVYCGEVRTLRDSYTNQTGYVNAVNCSGIKMVLLVTYILMRSQAFYDFSLRYLTAKSFFVYWKILDTNVVCRCYVITAGEVPLLAVASLPASKQNSCYFFDILML